MLYILINLYKLSENNSAQIYKKNYLKINSFPDLVLIEKKSNL